MLVGTPPSPPSSVQQQSDILSGQPGDTAEETTMELPAGLKGTTSSVERQHSAETRLFDLRPTNPETRKMYDDAGLSGYGFICHGKHIVNNKDRASQLDCTQQRM